MQTAPKEYMSRREFMARQVCRWLDYADRAWPTYCGNPTENNHKNYTVTLEISRRTLYAYHAFLDTQKD